MKNELKEIYFIFLLVYSILITILCARVCMLYLPNAAIVLHDYGQVFESEIDWKIWILEHGKDIT